jgi:hypothetical protein
MSQGPVPGSGGPWGTPAPFLKGKCTICSPDGTAYAHGGGPSEFFRGVRWNGSRAGAWACASTHDCKLAPTQTQASSEQNPALVYQHFCVSRLEDFPL